MLLAAASYDPITGLGCCGPRVCRSGTWLPRQLIDDCPQYDSLSDIEKARKRIFYDFEFWAASCVTIRDKLTGKPQRLILNSPQRRVLALMEMQRLMGRPIRLIMLLSPVASRMLEGFTCTGWPFSSIRYSVRGVSYSY